MATHDCKKMNLKNMEMLFANHNFFLAQDISEKEQSYCGGVLSTS
jgi:hypothetical protein